MGGNAIKDIRPLRPREIVPTYEWVRDNVFPAIGIRDEDASPIGSFGKKGENDTYGDIDIAVMHRSLIKEGLQPHETAEVLYGILQESFDCILMKGLGQVSLRVPICGKKSLGHAQVDIMPVNDLAWARFIYHSPNLAEGESKYKGAVRNALLMALLSESSKRVDKLHEGQEAEYSSLAVRFTSGLWNVRKSFMGKTGLVKTGKIMESSFVTSDPSRVVQMALGKGYGVGAANSFETLWEVMHRKDFVHRKKLERMMTKFKANLKSMNMEPPEEAIKRYPYVFEALSDVFRAKDIDAIIASIKDKKLTVETIMEMDSMGVMAKMNKEDIREMMFNINLRHYYCNPVSLKSLFHETFRQLKRLLKKYMSDSEIGEMFNDVYVKRMHEYIKEWYVDIYKDYGSKFIVPTTPKEVNDLLKQIKDTIKFDKLKTVVNLVKGKYGGTLQHALAMRIKNAEAALVASCIALYYNMRGEYVIETIQKVINMIDKGERVWRASFKPSGLNTNYLKWIDSVYHRGLRLGYVVNKPYFEWDKDVALNFLKKFGKQHDIWFNRLLFDAIDNGLEEYGTIAEGLKDEGLDDAFGLKPEDTKLANAVFYEKYV